MAWSITRTAVLAVHRRTFTSGIVVASQPPISRPGPPPLPRKDQKEFEELVKSAARPAAVQKAPVAYELKEQVHPDARSSPPPEFVGDVNPVTGEQGGPKREPIRHGDWSHSGRVTDF